MFLAVLASTSLVWNIGGKQQEVDAGTYARLYWEQDGWRVWEFETLSGTTCKAAKGIDGQTTWPLGASDWLTSGGVFVEVYSGPSTFTIISLGKNPIVEYRVVGEKFTNSADGDTLLLPKSEAVYEIWRKSWDYPAIYAGFRNVHFSVDFTGLYAARDAVRRCDNYPPP